MRFTSGQLDYIRFDLFNSYQNLANQNFYCQTTMEQATYSFDKNTWTLVPNYMYIIQDRDKILSLIWSIMDYQ